MIREKVRVMADKWKDNQKVAFLSCMLIGLVTHGYMYFNKLSWHDDMTLTHIGGTYASGRWFLGVVEWLVNQCGGYYILPVLQGCVSLFFIALSAMLVVDMLKITKKPLVVLTAGMMIAIPVMTALYAYMFTAAAYSLSIFLSILGVYFTWKIKGIQGILLGMGAICLGMGCYQAYVSAAVCVVCMISYLDIVDNPDIGLRKLVGGVFRYACTLFGGLFLYLIVNQGFLDVLNTQLSDYQGISSMGSLESILPGIKRAYLEFICPTEKLSYCMYMGSLKKVYFAALLLGGLLAFGYCIKIYKKNKCNMLIATIIILLFPIAVNFVFLMGSASVHSLMTYSQVMVFVMLSALAERVAPTQKAFGKILRGVSATSLGYALAFYINYDNQCYLKATFQQESPFHG